MHCRPVSYVLGIAVLTTAATGLPAGWNDNLQSTQRIAILTTAATGLPAAWARSPRVASGWQHGAALDGNGGLWSWGLNDSGQLGYDTRTDADVGFEQHSTIPQRVGTESDWADVALGSTFTLGLKRDGSLYSWGGNQSGELGLGDTTNRAVPTRIGTASDWRAIAAGARHAVALKNDGSLWTWGLNSHGELGTGWPGGERDFTAHSNPTQVGSASTWVAINAWGYHTLALNSDGSLWAWGDTSDGQSGVTPDFGPTAGPEGEYQVTPRRVGVGDEWVALGSGLFHSLAIRADGTLWSFGSNASGELGIGRVNSEPTEIPSAVGASGPWLQVTGGAAFTLGLRADGTLWSWGINDQGQLGYDTGGAPQTSPRQIGTRADWVGVATGLKHAFAMNTAGEIWGWGENLNGELGTGQVDPVTAPTLISWAPDPGRDSTAPQPSIDPPGGQFGGGVMVRLGAVEDSPTLAVIYFTTDGSDPNPGDDSQRYRERFLLTETATVKAMAVDVAGNRSAVVAERFTIGTESGGDGGGGGCFLRVLAE